MSSPIDELYRKAFPQKEFTYSDKYWQSVEGSLPTVPKGGLLSSIGSKIGVGIVAAATVSASVFLVSERSSPDLATTIPKASTNEISQKVNAIESGITLRGVLSDEKQLNYQAPNIQAEEIIDLSSTSSTNSSSSFIVDRASTVDSKSKPVSNLALGNPNNEGIEEAPFNSSNEIQRVESLAMTESEVSSLIPRLKDATEFGGEIKRSRLTRLSIEGFGGIHALELNNPISLIDKNNVEDLTLSVSEYNEIEYGVLVAFKRHGFKLTTGVGLNEINHSYNIGYNEVDHQTTSQILETQVIDRIDSTYVGRQYGIVHQGGKNYVAIMNTIYDRDTTWRTDYDTITKTTTNVKGHKATASYNIRYVSVPLMIGYQLSSKRLFIELNTGVNMGVLSSFSGSIIDPETGNAQELTDRSNVNSITLRYQIEAGVGFQFSEHVSVSVRPSLTHSLNGTFKSPSNNDFRYTGYGVRGGVRYTF